MKKGFYLSGLLAFCFVLFSVGAKAALPTIHKNPHDTTVCTGILATFTVAATDTPGTLPMTYKWQMSTDGTTWSTLTDTLQYSGSHTDTLKIIADTSLNGHWYRAIVTNTTGADTSTKGKLTVIPQPWAGIISGPSIVCLGSSIPLSDNVTGGVWSSSTTTIATVSASGVVTGAAQGYDTIKYKYTNACGNNTTSRVVRVDITAIPLSITGPSATCVGASINLSDANVTGIGVWSTSNSSANVSSAGIVTGVAGGSVNITYTFTNACNTVTATTTVLVETLLNHGVISGPAIICRGSMITLAETVGGGIWLSSSSAANVDPSGNVTGASIGTAVISYYLSNACGASIATYTVTVSMPASLITGGDSVGIGATLALSDSATGGMWSCANTAVATVGSVSGIVTGIGTGTTTITYTVTNICGTTSAILALNVGVPPSAGTITGADSVCIGASITLSDNVAGGVWSASNNKASVTGAGVVTGVTTGLDTFYYRVHNAFGTSQVRKIIFVNHLPILKLVGPNIVGLGGNYFFYGLPVGGTFTASNNHMGEFVSYFNALLYSGTDSAVIASVGSFVVVNSGRDTITYSYTNSCGTVDSIFVISLAAAGVNPIGNTNAALNVYPNPNQGEFTLNLSSGITEDVVVTVTNIVGGKVKELTISTNKPTDIKLDQPSGLYFLSAITANGRYTAKITITR
ncbi:MAG: T9SS type A sorting domain-containing protein [Chitinophagales bacterium]